MPALCEMAALETNSERKLTVIDIGCGSGWKLVNYLSKEFETIGIETEPAISFLREKYPDKASLQSLPK